MLAGVTYTAGDRWGSCCSSCAEVGCVSQAESVLEWIEAPYVRMFFHWAHRQS